MDVARILSLDGPEGGTPYELRKRTLKLLGGTLKSLGATFKSLGTTFALRLKQRGKKRFTHPTSDVNKEEKSTSRHVHIHIHRTKRKGNKKTHNPNLR